MYRMKEAKLYKQVNSGTVRCEVCENRCLIRPGKRGICGNYVSRGGKLYHMGYGKLSAVESRPIEIKPLFHYWPNSTALTFSNWGCNFHCPWCQNHHLSFRLPREDDPLIPPEDLVEMAIRQRDEGLCASFNEPTTNFDYLLDVFALGKRRKLYATMVTNGYLTISALKELVDVGVDGWSVDIKGCPRMRRDVLPHVNHELVFRNAKAVLDLGGHVEMIYLVVTGANDSEDCYRWIVGKHLDLLGAEVPLHVNRYYPASRWNEPPTSVSKLEEIADYARNEGLKYVYIGNIGSNSDYERTVCPRCGKTLIVRRHYRVKYFNLIFEDGRYRCPRCGQEIPIRGRYVAGKSFQLML